MTDLQITFNRLDDETWGVRLYDQAAGGTRHMNRTGETVEVALRDGTTKKVTLGAMRFTGNGDKAYYEIAKKRSPGIPTAAKPATAPDGSPVEADDNARPDLEARVAALEAEVARLKRAMAALLA